MTIGKQLRSVKLPRQNWTSSNWNKEVVSSLRDYFIVPRKDKDGVIAWLKENFNITEVNFNGLDDWFDSRTLSHLMQNPDDEIWLLENDSNSEMYYFWKYYDFWNGGENYKKGRDIDKIFIVYNKDDDEFTSNCNFLMHTIRYFRGINEEDIDNQSKERYPVRYGIVYAETLDTAVIQYHGYLRRKTYDKIYNADYLVVSNNKGEKTFAKEEFYPVFFKLIVKGDGEEIINSSFSYNGKKVTDTFTFYKDNQKVCVLEYTDDMKLYYEEYFYLEIYETGRIPKELFGNLLD